MTLAELVKVYGEMTPGEWRACNHNWDFQGYPVNSSFTIAMPSNDDRHLANKTGIVALHNHFPALVALVGKMREALEGSQKCLLKLADEVGWPFSEIATIVATQNAAALAACDGPLNTVKEG